MLLTLESVAKLTIGPFTLLETKITEDLSKSTNGDNLLS